MGLNIVQEILTARENIYLPTWQVKYRDNLEQRM